MKSTVLVQLNRAIVTLVLILTITACGLIPTPTFHISNDFSGQVRDVENDQPLAGVNVIAVWPMDAGGISGRRSMGVLEVKEAVTDANGRFRIEGFATGAISVGSVTKGAPNIHFFKSGFETRPVTRKSAPGAQSAVTERNDPDSATHWLKRYPAEAMANPIKQSNPIRKPLYDPLGTFLHDVVDACLWIKIPKAILAMNLEAERLRASRLGDFDLLNLRNLEGRGKYQVSTCPSAEVFFRNYKP